MEINTCYKSIFFNFYFFGKTKSLVPFHDVWKMVDVQRIFVAWMNEYMTGFHYLTPDEPPVIQSFAPYFPIYQLKYLLLPWNRIGIQFIGLVHPALGSMWDCPQEPPQHLCSRDGKTLQMIFFCTGHHIFLQNTGKTNAQTISFSWVQMLISLGPALWRSRLSISLWDWYPH